MNNDNNNSTTTTNNNSSTTTTNDNNNDNDNEHFTLYEEFTRLAGTRLAQNSLNYLNVA